MKAFTKSDILEIARRKSMKIDENWAGPGEVWPLLERMMVEGSVVVLKLDGEREPASGDNGRFTVVAMGGRLGDVTIRGDFESLDEGLSYLIGNYEELAKQ